MAIEEQWFKVLVLIVAAIVIIITAYNINTYRLLKTDNRSPINGEESNTLLILNIILLIFAIITFIWALYRILLAKDYREKIERNVTEVVTGTEYGYSPSETTVIKPASNVSKIEITKPAAPILGVAKPIAPIQSNLAVPPVSTYGSDLAAPALKVYGSNPSSAISQITSLTADKSAFVRPT